MFEVDPAVGRAQAIGMWTSDYLVVTIEYESVLP
jgi:hypothetical protein